MEEMMTSIRFTDEQEKQMAATGINKSELVRRAVDFYLLYLADPYNFSILNELEEWIKFKRMTHVPNRNTNVTQYNTPVTHMNTNVPICNTNNTDVTQPNNNKPLTNTNDNMKNILRKELPTIHNMLINPENNKTVPEHYLKHLAKLHAMSKSSILAWIVENTDWLLETDFTEDEHDE